MSFASRLVASLALACALLFAVSASAQQAPPSAADKAAAEQLFQEAKQLMADKRYAEACPKLAESLRLDTGIGTMLYLADCFQKNGQTASAWAEFKEAEYAAKAAKDEREAVAQKHAGELEPQLAHLAVQMPQQAKDVAGVEVRRDGELVGQAQWGDPLAVDPGKHTVEIRAPGRKPWSMTFEVPPQGNIVVTGQFGEPEGAPPPPPKKAPPPSAPPPPKKAVPPKKAPPPEAGAPPVGRVQRIVGIALGVAGLAGIIAGAALGGIASSDASQSNARCHGDLCDSTGLDLNNSALKLANGSTAGFVVGGAFVAAGLAVFFTAPKAAAQSKQGWQLAPAIGPGFGGASWQLTW